MHDFSEKNNQMKIAIATRPAGPPERQPWRGRQGLKGDGGLCGLASALHERSHPLLSKGHTASRLRLGSALCPFLGSLRLALGLVLPSTRNSGRTQYPKLRDEVDASCNGLSDQGGWWRCRRRGDPWVEFALQEELDYDAGLPCDGGAVVLRLGSRHWPVNGRGGGGSFSSFTLQSQENGMGHAGESKNLRPK